MSFVTALGKLKSSAWQATLRGASRSNTGAIIGDVIHTARNYSANEFAAKLTPENVQDWFATRIFGNRVGIPPIQKAGQAATPSPSPRIASNDPAQLQGRAPITNPARLLGTGSMPPLPPTPTTTQSMVRGSSRGPLARRGEGGLVRASPAGGGRGPGSAPGPGEFNDGWTRNSNMLYKTGKWVADNPKKTLGAVAAAALAGPMDSAAGYLYGGPGYGGYIGFGEGPQRGRSALQGARTNTNYQAQQMGLAELRGNQVSPQYSLSVPQSQQRRSSSSLRASTQGLTLGLHQGRHGGY